MTMMGVYTKDVSLDGGATSTAVQTEGGALVGAYVPASMAGTSLQIESSENGIDGFVGVYDSTNARISMTIDTTAGYRLFPQANLTFGADTVRLVSSATETGKTITLVFQKVA